MKNRIWVFVVAFVLIILFSTEKLSAQVTSHAYSGWIRLDSYKGSVTKEAFKYQVDIQSENKKELEYKDWSMQVRVNNSIVNSEGKTIDPSRISIQLSRFESKPKGDPELEDFEAIRTPIKLGFTDQYIIKKSDEELKSEDYYQQWLFIFDILIEGGAYLEEVMSWQQFPLGLTFTIRDRRGNIITEANDEIEMQIYPEDLSPSGPKFGFEVNANATLDFNTPEQYTRQVENGPNNSWINVTSKKSGYEITVKTNNPNFELIRNDSGVGGDATIPVNVVNVEMQSAGSGTSQGAKTLSSTIAQTLFIGTKNNNTQKLPVRYFITKTEAEKLATKTSGEYKAILTYTLEPN